jgi:hypothetical protein
MTLASGLVRNQQERPDGGFFRVFWRKLVRRSIFPRSAVISSVTQGNTAQIVLGEMYGVTLE